MSITDTNVAISQINDSLPRERAEAAEAEVERLRAALADALAIAPDGEVRTRCLAVLNAR